MEIRPRRSKFLDYNIEDALIGHHGNLSVKSELFQNVLYILRESIEIIFKVFFNMIRTANVNFESPDKMVISLGDIPVYHAKSQEFSDLLNDIYIKRESIS